MEGRQADIARTGSVPTGAWQAPAHGPGGTDLRRMAPRGPAVANLALLALYPLAWWAPVASAQLLPFFSGTEISILTGIRDLARSEPVLAGLVALFAVVFPYAKTLALAFLHAGRLDQRALPLLELLGKLSMADVFLIALYIVMVKGVGIGDVTSRWGLWLFTACVLGSIWIGHATSRERRQWD